MGNSPKTRGSSPRSVPPTLTVKMPNPFHMPRQCTHFILYFVEDVISMIVFCIAYNPIILDRQANVEVRSSRQQVNLVAKTVSNFLKKSGSVKKVVKNLVKDQVILNKNSPMATMLETSPTRSKTVLWIPEMRPVLRTVMIPRHVLAYLRMTIPILVLLPMLEEKSLNVHPVPKHPDVVPFLKLVTPNVLMKL